MNTDGNKVVVRRFVNEVLAKGNVDVIDELLGPGYVNPSVGYMSRDAFKAMITGMNAYAPKREYEILNLTAEGDSVFFRGNMSFTLANGKKVSVHVITYYRLTDGKIVEDDPISTPPLTEVLSGMIPTKTNP